MSNNQGDNQNYITKMEHDEEFRVKKVSNFISDNEGNLVREGDAQYPVSVDGDSVYAKDISNDIHTDIGTFTGDIFSLVNDYDVEITDVTATNPKTFTIQFNRPISSDRIGMGSGTGDFSNVKILMKDLSGTVRVTVDDSANNTKYTSNVYVFPPNVFIEMVVEFHTTDPVKLNGLFMPKTTQTISQIQGLKPTGTLGNVGVTEDGNLKTTDAENGLAIAKGNVTGTSFIHKFGNAPSIDTVDGFVDIWDGVDSTLDTGKIASYTFSTTDDIDTVSSSDNGDTQDIEIQGLDVNWDIVTQVKTLTGQTKVSLDTPLIRVFRMQNIDSTDIAGAVYCYVDGDISAGVPDTATDVRAIINNGNNQTLMSIYSIPRGKTGYARSFYAAMATKKTSSSIINLKSRVFGSVFRLKNVSSLNTAGTSRFQHTFVEPSVLTAKTDIIMSADTDTNDVAVGSGFDIVLVDD